MQPPDDASSETSEETLVPATMPESEPAPETDVDSTEDPFAPSPFFSGFANNLLNWSYRRVRNTHHWATQKLPSALRAPFLTLASFFGFFFFALLLHGFATVGIALSVLAFLFAEPLEGILSENAWFVLYAGSTLVGIGIQAFLLIRIALRVRNAASKGQLRVYNSYAEIVGNAALVLFFTFCGFILGLCLFFNPHTTKFVNLFVLFAVLEGGSAAALALFIHSCYVRNRHLGWKTAVAVGIGKYVASYFSYFCFMRIKTALERIAHPVSEREAAYNRAHDRRTMNTEAKRGRTEATNVAAEIAVATGLALLLKKTLDPLVTGRFEGELGGFAAAMQDFRAWRSKHKSFFIGVLVSSAVLCGLLAFGAQRLEARRVAAFKAKDAQRMQEDSVSSDRTKELSALGEALRAAIPAKAIPPKGGFHSADEYFNALAKKGVFKKLSAAVAEGLLTDKAEYNYIGGEDKKAAAVKVYAAVLEESGLFSSEGDDAPPICRIWTVVAGNVKNTNVPLFWLSNLSVSLDEFSDVMDDFENRKNAVKLDRTMLGRLIVSRSGTLRCEMVPSHHKKFAAQWAANDLADALGYALSQDRDGYELLLPSTAFDRKIVDRYYAAVDAAEKKLDDGAAAAETNDAMGFFAEGDAKETSDSQEKSGEESESAETDDTEGEQEEEHPAVAAVRGVVNPKELEKIVRVAPIPAGGGQTAWKADPYSGTATGTCELAVDVGAYRAWAKRVLDALSPHAVEVVPSHATITKNQYKASDLSFDSFDRGHPIHVVLDPVTLETQTLLFDDETWDALKNCLEVQFVVRAVLKGAPGEKDSETAVAVFGGVAGGSSGSNVASWGQKPAYVNRSFTPFFESKMGHWLWAKMSVTWEKAQRPKHVVGLDVSVSVEAADAPTGVSKSTDMTHIDEVGAKPDAFSRNKESEKPEAKQDSADAEAPKTPAQKVAPVAAPEPAPKAAPAPVPAAAPKAAPAPAKPDKLAETADRQAAAYREGTKTAEQLLKWLASDKVPESKRLRLRTLLEERGVPLTETENKRKEAETQRKAEEEAAAAAQRKAEEEAEAKRKAEEEAKRKAEEEAAAKRKAEEEKRKAENLEKFKAQQKANAEKAAQQKEELKKKQEETEAKLAAQRKAEEEKRKADEEKRQAMAQKIMDDMQRNAEAAAAKQKAAWEAAEADDDRPRLSDRMQSDASDEVARKKRTELPETPSREDGMSRRRTAAEEARAAAMAAHERGDTAFRRRSAAAEDRAAAAAARTAEWNEASRRAAEENRARQKASEEAARDAAQMQSALPAGEMFFSPLSTGDIQDEPLDGDSDDGDGMVDQLADGLARSVKNGLMTAAQAGMTVSMSGLTPAQKKKVRDRLAAKGVKLP